MTDNQKTLHERLDLLLAKRDEIALRVADAALKGTLAPDSQIMTMAQAIDGAIGVVMTAIQKPVGR